MKKTLALLMAFTLAIGLAACGSSGAAGTTEQAPAASEATAQAEQGDTTAAAASEAAPAATSSGEKIMRIGQESTNTSLDPHKEYFGWNDCVFGLNEALFKTNDDFEVEPWLADTAEMNEKEWTITLKDGICFSDGDPVTADMVVRNLQRVAEVNNRYSFIGDWEMEAVDDKTIKITTPEVYVTLPNDISDPSVSIVDLDHTTDFENNPICTGPFKVKSFIPSGDVEMVRNENYWGGEVKLDGALLYAMPDDESRVMAMQNGEIDAYGNVSAAAGEIFEASPDLYNLVITPGARLQYFMLNSRIPEKVRAAINLAVDKENMAAFLNGATVPAVGPFSTDVAYGKVTAPAKDTEKAKQLLEEDGYTMGASGFYEKDGAPLQLKICTYSRGGRFLDTLAVLLKEQLAAIGIDSVVDEVENPDQYISSGDFDIGFYCMIADKSGDPYYFIDAVFKDDVYLDCLGYDVPEIQEKIAALRYEGDMDKRAELANEIVQMTIDNNMYCYVGLFNKKTVLATGVSGFAENSPFDCYGLTADSDKP